MASDVNTAIKNVADALESQPGKDKDKQEPKNASIKDPFLVPDAPEGEAGDEPKGDKPKGDQKDDKSKSKDNSIPLERFQAKNRQLALMKMENDALKAAAKANQDPDPKPDGGDDDAANKADEVKAAMGDMQSIIREEIQKSMGGFTDILAQQAETRDIEDVRKIFGDEFDEARDLPDIKKIQGLHPTLSAELAFRMLDSIRNEPGQQEAAARANANVSLNNGRQGGAIPTVSDADVPGTVKRIVDSANEGIKDPKRKLKYGTYYKNYLERVGGQHA